MRCLGTLGRRDEAVRHYHDYLALMKKQLNLPPSAPMVALYETLLKS